MKILVANPNTSTGVTDRLVAAGKLVASPGTELLPMTAATACPTSPRAPRPLSAPSRRSRCWRNGAARSMRPSSPPSAIPAWAARASCSTFPVVGMAEAAMLTACMLGRSFAIVSFAKALEPWFAEIVAWHGLSGRCAAIRTLDEAFRSIDDVQDEKEQVLVDLANSTVTNDAADVVILAGAPLAGMADKVKGRIPVPVVDGIRPPSPWPRAWCA